MTPPLARIRGMGRSGMKLIRWSFATRHRVCWSGHTTRGGRVMRVAAILGTIGVAVLCGGSPAVAQGTLRIGMTAADIPLTTGQPDQGFEGYRFGGYTIYDALANWDLSSASKASDLMPGLAT